MNTKEILKKLISSCNDVKKEIESGYSAPTVTTSGILKNFLDLICSEMGNDNAKQFLIEEIKTLKTDEQNEK